jgi:hypothetical protein
MNTKRTLAQGKRTKKRKEIKAKKIYKGGDCGCNKWMGGKKKTHTMKMKGGYVDTPSFSSVVPSSSYYPYNELAGGPHDPTSPDMQPSSRLFPDMVSGGKRSRTRSKKHSGKHSGKHRGGTLIGSLYTNPLASSINSNQVGDITNPELLPYAQKIV